jgi:hypothetical protein
MASIERLAREPMFELIRGEDGFEAVGVSYFGRPPLLVDIEHSIRNRAYRVTYLTKPAYAWD